MAGRSSFVLDFGSIGFDSSVTLFTIIIPKRQDENLHRMIQAHTAAAHSHHLFWESACVQRRIRCTPHYFIVSSQRVITCCNKPEAKPPSAKKAKTDGESPAGVLKPSSLAEALTDKVLTGIANNAEKYTSKFGKLNDYEEDD